MADQSVLETMRAEWNERAQQDANYYVAFGRRNQTDEEFFASASDQIRAFETELKRSPAASWQSGAALEIGCGPGRLLRPLSRHFREIHGLDVADEMLLRAEANLAGVPNVRLHHAGDSSLAAFAGESIDFVYSYAVFQHIPSEAVVFNYLSEGVRVLRPGGLFVFQINGLPDSGRAPSTWEGARVPAEEIIDFSRRTGMLLLALNDKATQYMWVTLQKPLPEAHADSFPAASIFRIANAYTGDSAIPASGRFGAASIWISHLPATADLLSLSATVDGRDAYGCYISPPINGMRFFNVILPAGTRTGLVPIDVRWNGQALGPTAWARIIPPGPRIPRIAALSDGINLLSMNRVESGCAKLVMEEIAEPAQLSIAIGGETLAHDFFCVNPLHERYEFNFLLPRSLGAGMHALQLKLGGYSFAPVPLEIAAK